MIVVDQSFLIFKRMIQHLAPDRMLDVKEVVQEIHRAVDGICTFGKLLKFGLCVCFFSMWCFDQYCVENFAHDLVDSMFV
jgi:hypothetical protein